MKSIKLIQSLSPEEFKQLKLFLQSPFFNSDPNLIKLHAVLAKYYPSFSSRQCTKEKIFQKVFPKYKWNDAKWRNLLSKMVKALEEYLTLLEMKNGDLEERKLLAKAYGRRNLMGFFNKHLESLNQELQDRSTHNQDALLDRMLFDQLYYYHPFTNKLKNTDYLLNAKKEASLYFKAQQSKINCDLLVLAQIQGDLPINNASPHEEPVYIQLYEMVHLFLSEGSKDAFIKAKKFFEDNVENLNNEDQKFGLLHLINFSIRQHNMGTSDLDNFILELYQFGLNKNILIENGMLTEKTFDNILIIGCRFKQYDWVVKFIQNYFFYLPATIRDRAKAYGLGYLHFSQKDFSKAIDYFIQVNHTELTRSLIVKSILLRSYFEMFLTDYSYFELLINYATAFERLIKRKKSLEKMRKAGCINLSGFLKKIATLVQNNQWNEKAKIDILESVKMTNPVIVKNWLLHKIEEM